MLLTENPEDRRSIFEGDLIKWDQIYRQAGHAMNEMNLKRENRACRNGGPSLN